MACANKVHRSSFHFSVISHPARVRRLLWTLLATCSPAAAANLGAPNDASGCAACGSCGLFGGFLILIPICILVLNIALLVWVARDAKSRGMDSAVLWMVLVMVTSVVGLIIYIFSRPQGVLIRCPSCGNERLQASAKCPHCGNA
ncbi:MAG TPA: PLDc N-terminal domain-containing protein [Candidatus Dormibacteraeota bacterium]|nr:PLDc N-terminal domain-containing protein [Candidatus Dormibacteraeota bacterium]